MRERDSASAAVRTLQRVGVCMGIVYLLTFLFYLNGPQSRSRTAKEIFAWFLVLSLLFLFWRGYQAVNSAAYTSPRLVVGLGALLCLLACLIFPFHSTDVFGYINRGWQQVHYGQNPFVYFLDHVEGWEQDPMLRDHWIYNPIPYGFLFALLCRVLVRVGNGNWWLTLFLFKCVNVLAYGMTAWLVWLGAKRLGQARPVIALYCFLWNPLILMHHIANGHNDILTGCLIVLSVYLAIIGAGLWIIPALVAATLLKYATLPLIPLALVFVVKKNGWRVALLGCLMGAVVAALSSAPYLQDWRLFRLTDIRMNATLIDNSLHSLLIHIFENISRLFPALATLHDAVDSIIKMTLRLGFMIFFILQFRKLKDLSAPVLIEKSLLILFALICVASSKFNAWYLGMLLPFALLMRERHWLRRLVLLITGAELLSLTFFKQAYMLNYFAMILVPAWVIFRQERKRRAAEKASDELARNAAFASESSEKELPRTASASH